MLETVPPECHAVAISYLDVARSILLTFGVGASPCAAALVKSPQVYDSWPIWGDAKRKRAHMASPSIDIDDDAPEDRCGWS